MDIIKDILITYWKPIVGLIFLIIGFVLAVIKKKPVVDIMTDIYEYCILAVDYVESLSMADPSLKGEEKLEQAITFVHGSLKNKYPTLDVYKYYKLITKIIERILATPHKKV